MHIDAHSWYSFHDGVSSPADMCAQAAELGFPALGICDVDGVYGLIHFYKAAMKYDLHPVLGVGLTDPRQYTSAPETYVSRNGGDLPNGINPRTVMAVGDKAATRNDRPGKSPGGFITGPKLAAQHPTVAATVLARDRDGYSEVCALASNRRIDPGFQLDRALLNGTEHCYIITDRPNLLDVLARRLGPGRVFVRLAPDYGDDYRARQIRQLKLAQRYRLRPVACTDVHFLRPQDQPVHHVLRAIGQNATLDTATGVCPGSHYLSAPVELAGYYYDHPESVRNALMLAEGCQVEFELGKWRFPDYPLQRGTDPRTALKELCRRGLEWRYGRSGFKQAHLARLDYELKVIEDLGYTSYFLAVYDIVRAAGRMGIPCLGRGSAANSIVSYLLGLTPVDPIALNMYFERFLNPARKSPPDIDIDFSSKRRDDILNYVYKRWGNDRVAMISTHVTFRARGAFREVGKVFGLGERELSKVSKRIPYMNADGLTKAVRNFPEMRGIDFTAEPYRHIIPLASRLGGKPRHLGIHCGGIVIAPGRATDFTGLERAGKGLVVTQYEMYAVEDVGLIKIDLLGNCGLDSLEETLKALAKRGIKPPVHDLPSVFADQATVEMISTGGTMGCFYIESPSMRQLLKRLRTRTFLELTAASSVIRPGVAESGMMDEYIRRVRGQPERLPSHPLMQKLLPETMGVMVYQEDVIRVAHELAGFSLADADLLRRAMSGKLRGMEGMNEVRERFVEGCEKKGIAVQDALMIWRQIASFSGYSFCKAHSASFASLSFKVAYLKAHYPVDYMAAVLSHSGGFYGPRAYISECERLGIYVLPPDVNHSFNKYTAECVPDDPARFDGHSIPAGRPGRVSAAAGPVMEGPGEVYAAGGVPVATVEEAAAEPNAVRVGMREIKGIGPVVINRIIAERERGGRYRSLPDFIRRVRPGASELGILVQCGALDSLGMTRPELQWLADGERKAGLGGASLPLDDSERLGEFSARVGSTLSRPGEVKLCNLELDYFGMLVRRHPLSLLNGKVRGVVNARDMGNYAGKRIRMVGWCIATKRIDIGRRKQVRDTLALQSANFDTPVQYDDGGDDDDKPNPAADIGIIARRPSAGGDYYAATGRRAMKFMSMEDLTGTFEVTLFPDAYDRLAPATRFPGPFLIYGQVEEQYETYSINAIDIRLLDMEGNMLELG